MSEAALADLRVVEVAQGVAGPYCTRLFADLGADVVKVEPPQGDISRRNGPFAGDLDDPERSGQFLYLNLNKRSIAIDLEDDADRQLLDELVTTADVLVVDLALAELERLSLDYATLAARHPRLIVTRVSPFGGVGPYRDYAGNAFTSYHAGGLGWGTPHNEVTDPPSQPPLAPGGYLADYVAGSAAAAGTMVAVAYRAEYGVGQLVDVSAMEAVSNALRGTLGALSSTPDVVPLRAKSGFPWVSPCQDGHVSLSVLRDNWWVLLKQLMGEPEWAQSELFDTGAGRQEHSDLIETLITEWLMQHSKSEIYRGALELGIPGFPVFSIAELLDSTQYRARNFFIDVEHPLMGTVTLPGPPARFSRTPHRITRPAPLLDEHHDEVRHESTERLANVAAASSAPEPHPIAGGAGPPMAPAAATAGSDSLENQPLRGVRIVDFGWILSVPHATAWLSTLGAEVIRIESRANLDQMRLMGMTRGADGIPGINRSGGFNSLNFGKKSITLNLATPEGVDLAKELVRQSDVVTENFAAGKMDALGLGYEALRAVRPDLIMLSGSTLGQTGPERAATGWGPNSMAVAGVPHLTGYAGGPPSSLDATFPDFAMGVHMAFSLLAALHERRGSGQGQYIDLAMAEAVTAMIPEAVFDYTVNGRESERRGNRSPIHAPQGVYPCLEEDSWAAISVTTATQWLGLGRALGDPSWVSDPRMATVAGRFAAHDDIDRELAAWTCQFSNAEVMRRLQAEGVPAVAVLSAVDVTHDPQIEALGYMVDVDHPEVGVRRVPGHPNRYSAMPDLTYRPTPLLGEHNEEVFCGLLGLSSQQFNELVADGTIY